MVSFFPRRYHILSFVFIYPQAHSYSYLFYPNASFTLCSFLSIMSISFQQLAVVRIYWKLFCIVVYVWKTVHNFFKTDIEEDTRQLALFRTPSTFPRVWKKWSCWSVVDFLGIIPRRPLDNAASITNKIDTQNENIIIVISSGHFWHFIILLKYIGFFMPWIAFILFYFLLIGINS